MLVPSTFSPPAPKAMLTTPLLPLLLLLAAPCSPKHLLLTTSPKHTAEEDKAYRLMQRGVAKALKHLKVKLTKEAAGDKVLAKIEEMDRQNKAEMKEVLAGGKLSHIDPIMTSAMLKKVRKAAEVLVSQGPLATQVIEQGVEKSLLAGEDDGDGDNSNNNNYQIQLNWNSDGQSSVQVDIWKIAMDLGKIPMALAVGLLGVFFG